MLYNVPNQAQWAYRYEITVPVESDECLYDITLTDLAPRGGIGSMIDVLAVNETLCPGTTKYIPGPTRTFDDAPEGAIDATVKGYGYYSGTLVSSTDYAAVKRVL